MGIQVFKTSITKEDTRLTNWILRAIIPNCSWSYDLEDCDNILRIESNEDISQLVCFHLRSEGFVIEELE